MPDRFGRLAPEIDFVGLVKVLNSLNSRRADRLAALAGNHVA